MHEPASFKTQRFILARPFILCLFLLVSVTLFGNDALPKDTVYLRNGELLIGDIKELRVGVLTFDSKDVGLIHLKISKIKTLSSSSDTLRIETANKAIYFGSLKPSAREGWVNVVTAFHSLPIEVRNINTLLPFEPRFWDNISGNASAGFSYSRSSGIGQLNASFSVKYTARKFELSMAGSGIASIDTATFSRDREDVDITMLYNIRKMWYTVFSIDYQRNLQLSISRRFQQTFAGGYKVVFSPRFQLMGIGGLSVSQERSTTGADENFLCEVPIGFILDYFKFSHPNMQISSDHVFYTGITQWGRVRYDSKTSFAWELFKDFSFSLSLYMNYDNRPPDSTTGKTDYGMVVGLSYEF